MKGLIHIESSEVEKIARGLYKQKRMDPNYDVNTKINSYFDSHDENVVHQIIIAHQEITYENRDHDDFHHR